MAIVVSKSQLIYINTSLVEIKLEVVVLALKIQLEFSIFPPPNLHARRHEDALTHLVVSKVPL